MRSELTFPGGRPRSEVVACLRVAHDGIREKVCRTNSECLALVVELRQATDIGERTFSCGVVSPVVLFGIESKDKLRPAKAHTSFSPLGARPLQHHYNDNTTLQHSTTRNPFHSGNTSEFRSLCHKRCDIPQTSALSHS